MDLLRHDSRAGLGGPEATYEQVAELLRQGLFQEARLRAIAIPIPHVRDMALVLVERTRPLAA